MAHKTLAIAILVILGCSCSTKLLVAAVPVEEPKEGSWAGEPDGVVVNRFGTYTITVNGKGPFDKTALARSPSTLSLVDPIRVLEINYKRLPFANGKLTLELSKDTQTVMVGGVSGTQPLVNAVKGADKALATGLDVDKLESEE